MNKKDNSNSNIDTETVKGFGDEWEKFDQSDPFDFVFKKQYVNEQNHLVRDNLF